MYNIDLTGYGTALITPFKNGKVDYDAFAALVDRQVEAVERQWFCGVELPGGWLERIASNACWQQHFY